MILIVWILIAAGQYFFDTNDFFNADPWIVSLFEAEYMVSAIMSFAIASVIGYSVLKIWKSLKMMPNL